MADDAEFARRLAAAIADALAAIAGKLERQGSEQSMAVEVAYSFPLGDSPADLWPQVPLLLVPPREAGADLGGIASAVAAAIAERLDEWASPADPRAVLAFRVDFWSLPEEPPSRHRFKMPLATLQPEWGEDQAAD